MKSEKIVNCVDIDSNADKIIRRQLGIDVSTRKPKIAFIPGPGDVHGTFNYWLKNEHDPRVPVIAYSTQFYSLIERLNAQAIIFHESEANYEHNNNFSFVSIKRKRSNNKIQYILKNFTYSFKLLLKLYKYKPDVVIVSTDIPTLVLSLAPKKWNLILTAHNTYWNMGDKPTSLKRKIKLKLISHGLNKLSAAVCTSAECARQISILTNMKDNLFVETPQFPKNIHISNGELNKNHITNMLFLGRIEKNKGIFDLVDVFEKLSDKYPNLILNFAGTGNAEDALRNRLKDTTSNINFLGKLSAVEVHKILDNTHLLICPTRSDFNEGLAMVCIEAALHMVPCVVSSNVPARDLLKGSCVVYPVDNTTVLFESLESLLSNPQKYQKLQIKLTEISLHFFERNKSWGSMLYEAMKC